MSEQIAEQLRLLPFYLGHHLRLTLAALALGILITIPLSLLAVRVPKVRGALLAFASVIQTIPSIAMLALIFALVARIGYLPALIALTLYSILPILRNTVTGILNVDPALIEAARGVGMTENQMLLRVQLPLASPVIIAGIRTATVWVVGIATLATPIGARSLGHFIFGGLRTQNTAMVLVGCIAAAVLAIVLDQIVRLSEEAAARRSRRLGMLAGAGLAIVILGGLVPLGSTQASATMSGEPIRIGSKTFNEQYILGHLLADHLQDEGFAVDYRSDMGSKILFDALASGEIDCYVDYSGTIWATVMKRERETDAQVVLDGVTRWLHEEHGILNVGRLGFENTYALAMPRERAEQLGITSIDDLASHANSMRIAGDFEFFARDEWTSVQKTYGVKFAESVPMDAALMYSAAREGQVDVIVAFSTDGRLAAYDLLVLDDPRGAFPPYDAILLLCPDASKDLELVATLKQLTGSISDEAMRNANKAVDVDKLSPAQSARELLRRALSPE